MAQLAEGAPPRQDELAAAVMPATFDQQRTLLVAAFQIFYEQPPRYSAEKWDDRLGAALAARDRHHGREGAGAAELLETMEIHAVACADGRALHGVRTLGGGPPRPQSFAMFVTELESWVRQQAADARADRADDRLGKRIERARRALGRVSVANELNWPEQEDLRERLEADFDRRMKRELRRRGDGRWCRVRRALRQTLQDAGVPLHGGPRERALMHPDQRRVVRKVQHADVLSWRADWKDFWRS